MKVKFDCEYEDGVTMKLTQETFEKALAGKIRPLRYQSNVSSTQAEIFQDCFNEWLQFAESQRYIKTHGYLTCSNGTTIDLAQEDYDKIYLGCDTGKRIKVKFTIGFVSHADYGVYEVELLSYTNNYYSKYCYSKCRKFNIQGSPIGKARAKTTTFKLPNGKYSSRMYDNVNNVYEKKVKLAYINKYKDNIIPLNTDIKVKLVINYGIPASWSKKKQTKALSGEISPTVKPDIDNVAKIILDSLNKVAYVDDKDIVELVCVKQYDASPCVEVEIYYD